MMGGRPLDQKVGNLALIAGLIAATITPVAIHIVKLDDLGIPNRLLTPTRLACGPGPDRHNGWVQLTSL